MAGVRFADVQSRPTEFLALTSVTLDEFQQLVPPFKAAFHAHMAAWRLGLHTTLVQKLSLTYYTHNPLSIKVSLAGEKS